MLCKGRVCATSQPSLCCVCESVRVARAASDGTGWSLRALSHVCHVTVCVSSCSGHYASLTVAKYQARHSACQAQAYPITLQE